MNDYKPLDLLVIGAGMIVWHPKGCLLRYIIEDFEVKEHLKRGYDITKGPQLLKTSLWEKSGHFDNYRVKVKT